MRADSRLPDLFAEASELEGEDRAAWLENLRREDAPLALEIEELLAASPSGERKFETPAWERLPADTETETPIPDRVGPYRVLREIGRGGMGRVFLAEQEGGEFRREVALKIIDGLGSDTIHRFRDEVRILASLEHPGIARFYDGGRAPDGRWFLALEYVEGEDLLSYVRSHGLDVRARVELLLHVLEAVDFAHRRLVVHRDLKPSNVLVGADGRARLLDFGISKIVDPDADHDATRTLTRVFTPDYASPEQLRGARATVATDVYSLGVVLYELLAGRRPFARTTDSGLDLASLGRDPEAPSTAVRRTTAPSAAAAHGTTTAVAWRDLTGDLDAITLRALRAEPERRYLSVEALAADLRRWLADKPVEARRGGRRYRVAKFVRRHHAAVIFASVAVLVLVAGVAGVVVQSGRARRAAAEALEQRDFALRELTRAEAMNELNAFLLSDVAPGARSVTAGELLRRAEQILERQRGGTEERAEMLIALGSQYSVQLEEVRARRLLTEAYELARRSPERATRAKAACALAGTLARTAEAQRAERLFREGMAQLSEEPQFVLHRVFCLLHGADVARRSQKGPTAVARAHAAQRLLRDSRQGSAFLDLQASISLANSYRVAGRLSAANETFEQAWIRLTEMGRAETDSAIGLLNTWGMSLRGLGRPRDAEELFRRAVRIGGGDRAAEGTSPLVLINLGLALIDLERLHEAKDCFERAYVDARRDGNELATTLALARRNLVYLRLGDLPRAESTLAELEPRVTRVPAPTFASVVASQRAMLAEARGNTRAARAAHDRAIALGREEDTITFVVVLSRRAAFELANGRPDAAAADAARALAVAERITEPGTFSSHVGWAQLNLAEALRAQGKTAKARAAAAAALEHLEASVGADHPDTRAARDLAQ